MLRLGRSPIQAALALWFAAHRACRNGDPWQMRVQPKGTAIQRSAV